MEDLTGRQFGPYRIVSPLGEGGMAAVYKAYQPGVDRYVAVKVLPRQLADEPQFVGRFEQEARVLANLQHPHILPVFDFGQADGYTYIVMPFIGTGTLADLLQDHPLPLSDIERIISQIGSALDYAHGRGLIHRDIKPSNILLDEQGNCLLADFGIAKLYEGTVNFTRTGGVLGTPAYISPEQGRGAAIDHRSDIYSLGVVLYEMATGRVPFRAETPIAVVFKHVQDPLPPPRTFNPQLPEALERVILKALAKQPEDRFSAAGEMADALKASAEGVPAGKTLLDAPPSQASTSIPSGAPSARAFSRRYVATGIAAVFLLLLLGVGGWWAFLGRSQGLPAAASSEPPGAAVDVTLPATETPEPAVTVTILADISSSAEPTHLPTATPSPAATASATIGLTSTPLPGEVRANPADNAPVVFIPAGQFTMGMTDAQASYLLSACSECQESHFAGSKPAHTVRQDSFWIYQTEVTNEMYAACTAGGNCPVPEDRSSNLQDGYWGNSQFADYPVINVNWFAADQYCRWAGGRLPTEAEWEKAARGDDGRLFPWGDALPDAQLANVGRRDGDTRPVGSYPQGASPYGVQDMAGNVWEWAADWSDPNYFSYSPLENPPGPETSPDGTRVGKGGSWYWHGAFASSAYHDWWEPENAGTAVGFRCVVDSVG